MKKKSRQETNNSLSKYKKLKKQQKNDSISKKDVDHTTKK
jgi:hypothetical protein